MQVNNKSLIHLSFKFALKYLLIFYSLTLVIFFALNIHRNNNFTQQRLENMITQPSKFRDITDSPCRYSVLGDPVNAEGAYVKVEFNCKNSLSSKSTLWLKIIPDKSVRGVLAESARILGFDVNLIISNPDKWDCQKNLKKVTDFSIITEDAATIACNEI